VVHASSVHLQAGCLHHKAIAAGGISVRTALLLILSHLLTFSLSHASSPQSAPAAAFPPLEASIPADAMAAYFGRPTPDMFNAPPGGTAEQLASWLITLKGMGVIPKDGRVAADVIGTLPILWRRPHVAVLLDITTQDLGQGSYRLDRMQVALVIAHQGIELAVERRIRDLLATYTDEENGTITPQTDGGIKRHRLVDRRLPDWAVTEWGQVGDVFLITFGEGAFERMVAVMQGREPSLADDAWFRLAHAQARGSSCGIEVYADLVRIRRRLEEDAKDVPAAVLRALHLEEAEKLVWTTGHDERAIRSVVFGRDRQGQDHFIILAGRENAAPEVAARIPTAADSYLVLRMPLGPVFGECRKAYFESQSPGQQRAVHELWHSLQTGYAFDSQADLLDQLGDHLIVHTFPAHPLRLPMLCTIWVQIAGDHTKVARTVDRMMTAWKDALNRVDPITTMPTYRPPKFRLSPQVRREPDGLWSLQLGFINPAVAVTEGWMIVSWSPAAVRANLEYLGTAPTSLPAE